MQKSKFYRGYDKLIEMLTPGNLSRDNIDVFRNYARLVDAHGTELHHRLMVSDVINSAIRQVSQGDDSLVAWRKQ